MESREGPENWLEAEGNEALKVWTAELAVEEADASESDAEEDPSSDSECQL